MTRVDAHLHLWDPAEGYATWLEGAPETLRRPFTASEAMTHLDDAGIEQAVLVQAADATGESLGLLRHAADWPDRVAGVVGWVDLERPEVAGDRLDELSAHGPLVGIRQLIHDDPRPGLYGSDQVRATCELLAERGLPLDIPDAFPRDLEGATSLARAIPALTVVLDHLGKPPRGDEAELGRWREQLTFFASLPNTVAKMSGLHRPGQEFTADALRDVVEVGLGAFGADRLMWGSDWPVSTLGGSYQTTVATLDQSLAGCGLSDSEWAALTGGTARRVYGLPT